MGRPHVTERSPSLGWTWRRTSDHLVRLVRVFFGVVAGQRLVLHRNVIVSSVRRPADSAAVAPLSIYMMIVWSWIDRNTMETRPYEIGGIRAGRAPSNNLLSPKSRVRLPVEAKLNSRAE
jgi:hypothetical protein